ncbi:MULTISPECIES: hypothetical protein [Methylorubrum]|uniref:Uncharacterized protein n=1 Tax=Methylorubrum populi TaxID=223967 RepID=A0A833MX12_9HYPH|nr:hypothetical protein [Methylorubrum populi]KAB7784842.1 hypothetical protein F8B43_2875 [Methylorubrum populi]
MNASFLVAFVVTPLFAVALGYAALRWHAWDLDRRHRKNPAE